MKSTSCWVLGNVFAGNISVFFVFQWIFAVLAPSGKGYWGETARRKRALPSWRGYFWGGKYDPRPPGKRVRRRAPVAGGLFQFLTRQPEVAWLLGRWAG